VDHLRPVAGQGFRCLLRSAEGRIEALEDGAHLLGVGLFFLEANVLLIVDDVLLHSVLELVLVLASLDV